MNVEQLVTLSRIFLVCGILLTLLAVAIYIKLDIYKAWHIVTGHRIRKQRKKISLEDKTVELGVKETIKYTKEERKRIIMEQMPETVPLKEIRMKYDVTFVHTQIRI